MSEGREENLLVEAYCLKDISEQKAKRDNRLENLKFRIEKRNYRKSLKSGL